MTFLALQSIDWMNAVIIPFLMTVVIGLGLAIWTSVVMARMVAFDQAKMAACRAIARISHLADAKTYDEMNATRRSIAEEFNLLNGEFVRLRQAHACSHMLYFCKKMFEAPWKDPSKAEFPLSEQTRDEYLWRLCDQISVFAKMIFDEQPLLRQLVTLKGYVKSTESVPGVDFERIKRREALARAEIQKKRTEQGFKPPY